LKRLENYKLDHPIFFITACTYKRLPILASSLVASILLDEWKNAKEKHNWVVGRYVIMPDHVHFFCTADNFDSSSNNNQSLSRFMQQWKQWTGKRILYELSNRISEYPDTQLPQKFVLYHVWQAGFFDHVLRSSESYNEKWKYVLMNPVRKGLVQQASDWQFQGEIFEI
jgi:REP element-mobilizing transposase RayT